MKKKSQGFTVIELLISLFVLGTMIVIISSFASNIFSYNKGFSNSLSISDNSRTILNPISSEIRSATTSSTGTYPIESAGTTSFIFYADTNSDGIRERIRYFLSGTTLRRGTITPIGNPLSYNTTETLTDVVYNVRNTAANPIFTYYDTNYTGSSAALSQPVDISTIRLIKIELLLDANTEVAPDATVITTQISLRNLKDNY